MTTITYTVVGGDIPIGTDVQQGVLQGVAGWENVINAPVWVTPSSMLGVFPENTAIPASGEGSIPALVASVTDGGSFIRYATVKANTGSNASGLPWGLILNPVTGVISGHVQHLLAFDAPSFFEEEAPVWVTPSTQLLNVGELEPISYVLVASGLDGHVITKYSVIKGALPWGAVLNKNGTISGTAAATVYKIEADSMAGVNVPRWRTPPGLVGLPVTGETISITLAADVVSPATKIVKYTMVDSVSTIPWGLTFNSKTGVLSGTIRRPHRTTLADLYVWPNGPTWNTPAGSLGDIGEQMVFNLTLDVVPQLGTLKNVSVHRGALPWGLTLNTKTGVISGITAPLNPGTDPQSPIANPPVWNAPLLVSGNPSVAGSGNNLGTFSAGSSIQIDIKATLADSSRTMKRYTVSTVSGGIPLGLTYNSTTGRLGGTLRDIKKTSTFTVLAIDSAGATSSRTFTITVN